MQITPKYPGNKDDLPTAVKALDMFTKNWCMNCSETNKGELAFRCKECNFCDSDNRCEIKKFVIDKMGKLPSNFGSMGSL